MLVLFEVDSNPFAHRERLALLTEVSHRLYEVRELHLAHDRTLHIDLHTGISFQNLYRGQISGA
jgi:hypothetical protein